MQLHTIMFLFFIMVTTFGYFWEKQTNPECKDKTEKIVSISEVGANYSVFQNEQNELKKVYNKSYKVGDEICSEYTEKVQK